MADQAGAVSGFLKSVKGMITLGTATVAAIVAASGTITDYARLPKKVAALGEQVKAIENRQQDRMLMDCVEAAEDDAARVACMDRWKEAEAKQ